MIKKWRNYGNLTNAGDGGKEKLGEISKNFRNRRNCDFYGGGDFFKGF